jgi:TonB family protein
MARRRSSASLAVAIALHGALVVLLTWQHEPRLVVTSPGVPAPADPLPAEEIVAVPIVLTPVVGLSALSTVPLEPVVGPADEAGFGDSHPLPNADVDLPGERAASLGGGAEGGSVTWTGRSDREDLRAQSWNAPDRYQLGRKKTGGDRVSTESIARAPELEFDDRSQSRRRRARRGQDRELEADPDGTEAPARVDGALDSTRRGVHADVGAAATEAERDGPTADDTNSAAASNERNPGAFEMTRPRAGGGSHGSGVAGPVVADGVSARGHRANAATAALRAALRRSPKADAATRARRQNAYFRKMYARLDGLIEFPRELALAMEQGEVVVSFTLYADGTVDEVDVDKSSGFALFDEQVTRAVAIGGPFGHVPKEIMGTRSKITVRAPYVFRNPLIR